MASKPKKHVPTPAEITNDGSLRWVPYRPCESLWSDSHRAWVRFLSYTPDGRIVLASDLGIAAMPGSVCPLSVRRLQPDEKCVNGVPVKV